MDDIYEASGSKTLDIVLEAAQAAQFRPALAQFGVDSIEDLIDTSIVRDIDLVTEIGMSRADVRRLRLCIASHENESIPSSKSHPASIEL